MGAPTGASAIKAQHKWWPLAIDGYPPSTLYWCISPGWKMWCKGEHDEAIQSGSWAGGIFQWGHEMGTWTLAIASLMVTLAIATLITLAIGFGTLLVTLSVYQWINTYLQKMLPAISILCLHNLMIEFKMLTVVSCFPSCLSFFQIAPPE